MEEACGSEGLNGGRNESRTHERTAGKAQAGQRLLGEAVDEHGQHRMAMDVNEDRKGGLWAAPTLVPAGEESIIVQYVG